MNHNKRKTGITLPWKYPISTMVSFTPHKSILCEIQIVFKYMHLHNILKIPIYFSFPTLHVTSLFCELFSTLKYDSHLSLILMVMSLLTMDSNTSANYKI